MQWDKIIDKVFYRREYRGTVIKDGVPYKKYKKSLRFNSKHKQIFVILMSCAAIVVIIYLMINMVENLYKEMQEKGRQVEDIRERAE